MDLKEKLRTHIQDFKILTPGEIDLIVENTIVKFYERNSYLIKEGQIRSNCFTVVEGCVREYILVDGEEKTTSFYIEGDSITSYTAEGKDLPSKNNLVCAEDCVLTMSTQSFEDKLRSLIRLVRWVMNERK